MPQKRSEINMDTLIFILHAILITSTTVEDFILQDTSNIIYLLLHLPKSAVPVFQLGETIRNGLLQVSNLLNSNQVTSDILNH